MVDQATTPYPVVVDPSATPVLTGTLKQILDDALVELQKIAARLGVMPTRVDIFRWQSYEDPTDQLVIAFSVEMDGEKALDFWTDVGDAFAAWAATLPPDLYDLAIERLTVSVEWPIDADTI